MVQRRIEPAIADDLTRKMVLLAGPRQCGKTTLARRLCEAGVGRYYSWDIARDRKALLAGEVDPDARLWALDEIHKNLRWRNWLKGLYDEHHPRHAILVTGSARLDLYSRGGDSLQGRYHFHRLHPITLSELVGLPLADDPIARSSAPPPITPSARAALDELLSLGGFPEPLLGGSARQASRWRLTYGTRLVREEVRDLETVRDLDRLELLFDCLASTVGSPLSVNSLREDLEVAHATVASWISVFERLYGVFRIPPFGPPRIKAVKETKLYFWDWSRVESEAARFENLVAVHLLRLVHWLEDVLGRRCELRYLRDVTGHEVDFVILEKGRPILAIETKLDDRPLDPGLRYFLERVKVPHAVQISRAGTRDFAAPAINGCSVRVMPAVRFLGGLP